MLFFEQQKWGHSTLVMFDTLHLFRTIELLILIVFIVNVVVGQLITKIELHASGVGYNLSTLICVLVIIEIMLKV